MINKKYYPLLLGVFTLVPIILAYQTYERNLGEGKAEERPISSQAVKQVLEKHPDYRVIKNSDTFHDWVDEQNQQIKNWTYHNPSDAKAAITVLDLFKEEHPNLGCFEGDCVNGKGHYFFSATTDYEGEFKNGNFDGLGIYSMVREDSLYRQTGSWKAGEPVDTEIWKLRQIGLLEEGHSWWYSLESINHTSEYVEYDDLDSYTSGSMVTRIQIDCKNNKVRPTRIFAFDNAMPLGEAIKEASIENQDFPDDWLDIPEQNKADLYINICEATRLTSAITEETVDSVKEDIAEDITNRSIRDKQKEIAEIFDKAEMTSGSEVTSQKQVANSEPPEETETALDNLKEFAKKAFAEDSEYETDPFLRSYLNSFKDIPSEESQEAGKAQYKNEDIFTLSFVKANEKQIDQTWLLSKKGYIAQIESGSSRIKNLDELSLNFEKDKMIISTENSDRELTIDTIKMELFYDGEEIVKVYNGDINSLPASYSLDEFIQYIKDSEEQKRYDKIYNACLLDKAKGMSMEVDSVRDAVEGACDDIAKDPSWLDNLRYN